MFKNDQISAGIWKLLEVEFHLGLEDIFNEMIHFFRKKNNDVYAAITIRKHNFVVLSFSLYVISTILPKDVYK